MLVLLQLYRRRNDGESHYHRSGSNRTKPRRWSQLGDHPISLFTTARHAISFYRRITSHRYTVQHNFPLGVMNHVKRKAPNAASASQQNLFDFFLMTLSRRLRPQDLHKQQKQQNAISVNTFCTKRPPCCWGQQERPSGVPRCSTRPSPHT